MTWEYLQVKTDSQSPATIMLLCGICNHSIANIRIDYLHAPPCLYVQLRRPVDIAVRVENYAAAKMLLDARGGPVSISFECN